MNEYGSDWTLYIVLVVKAIATTVVDRILDTRSEQYVFWRSGMMSNSFSPFHVQVSRLRLRPSPIHASTLPMYKLQ